MGVYEVRVQKQMRVKVVGPVDEQLPLTARVLIDTLTAKCKERAANHAKFTVHALPKSVNSMYLRNKYPGSRGKSFRLHPDVEEFRLLVMEAMGQERWRWRPTSLVGVVMLFESPYWLDGRRRVRQSDLDNRVKVVCDAIEKATAMPDELNWEIHLYKLSSKHKRTTVYLFDLGDLVEYYF